MATAETRKVPRPVRWGVVAAIAIVAGAALTFTPLFAARDIRVRGTDLARREILAVASVHQGTNVAHLDGAEVERRLERDPRILQATVTTSLPGTIRIAITEREPVAVAEGSYVGPDGVLIEPAGATAALPVIHGADLRTGAAAAAAMPEELREAVNAITVRADGGIGVRLAAGFSADLGDGTELAAKAASLAALLAWVTEQGIDIASADVTVPGSPTARLEDGGTVAP
jgi:cell division septal protein FtsQ